MTITIEDRKPSNTAAEFNRFKTVRGGKLTRQKDFDYTLYKTAV